MKNGKPVTLEARLASLEADVKEIREMLQAQQKSKKPWWEKTIGIFANDPVADEVRKIIEKNRERERSKAQRPARKKKQPAGS
jgi:hypothetical protein